MFINVQNKDYGYKTEDYYSKSKFNSSFQIFEPPLSKCDFNEIVFISDFDNNNMPIHTYTLGYYKDLKKAKEVVAQIHQAIQDKSKTFIMPLDE